MKTAHLLDALSMCLLNLFAAGVLTTLHVVNALYHWPNAFVTVAAPLAAAVFFVIAAAWLLEFSRRAHRSQQHGRRARPRLSRRPTFRRSWALRSL